MVQLSRVWATHALLPVNTHHQRYVIKRVELSDYPIEAGRLCTARGARRDLGVLSCASDVWGKDPHPRAADWDGVTIEKFNP